MRQRNRKKPKTKNRKLQVLRLILVPFALLIILLVWIFLRPKFWDGKSRLAVASWQGGGVAVTVYDPGSDKLTQINIPENLQVQAAFNLGTWQAGSLWELGEQHKLGGGRVLSASLTKSLGLPIEAFLADNQTNLNLGDRIAIFVFKLTTKEASQVRLDLAETNFLYKEKLADGSLGYKAKQTPPLAITTIFSDSGIIAEGKSVVLVDQSGSREKVQKVGRIIEVLGTKIIALRSEEPRDNLDCTVSPKGSVLSQKVAQVFACRQIKGDPQKVEVTFGKKFLERF